MWPFTAQRKARAGRQVVIRAKYDAAQTTADNRKHWANADSLSADAAGSSDIRKIIRDRARYEVANNTYAKGILLTLANDCIGKGPRLQMLTDDAEKNERIENAFHEWMKAVRLPSKLRTMRIAKAQDGEAFAKIVTKKKVKRRVKMDIQLVEADRVESPKNAPAVVVGGIQVNEDGDPETYFVMKKHPGGAAYTGPVKFDEIGAMHMIHWFREDRPEQHRGICEIMSALPLLPQLRRYTQAVIMAAESAAEIAVLMKTTTPAGGEAAEVEPMTEMEFAPNTAMFVPEGWDPSQIKAEQPATTYDMFKREILNEIARPVNMPYNIAACNSSDYNYASGRLDHQTYDLSIGIEQEDAEGVAMEPIFDAWFPEADAEYSFEVEDTPHQWFWGRREHVDPAKEATAQATKLANHTTTLAAEYAPQRKDWEAQIRQRGKEVALLKEVGLPVNTTAQAPSDTSQTADDDDEENADERQQN